MVKSDTKRRWNKLNVFGPEKAGSWSLSIPMSMETGNHDTAIIKRILPDLHLSNRNKSTYMENTEIHSL